MADELRLDKMSAAEREKHIKENIERKRHQRGTADKSLKKLQAVTDVPLAARDELKALRASLRDVRDAASDDIDDLRAKLRKLRASEKPDGGAGAAVAWALKQVGITENPAGSNWGHPVEDWIKYTGYTTPEPWCGCFVCFAVVNIGGAAIPVRSRMGYGPSIIADANTGVNGFHAVPFSQAQAGDHLILWGGEHQALCRGKPSGSTIPTVEGNTSPSSAGSQFNGGCVAAKTRNASDISVVARPNYPH